MARREVVVKVFTRFKLCVFTLQFLSLRDHFGSGAFAHARNHLSVSVIETCDVISMFSVSDD